MNVNLKYIASIVTFFLFQIVFSQDYYTSVGVSLFVLFSVKFFTELGCKIEIKDIMILLGILQWIIGPLLSYNFYQDNEFYYMAVNQHTYMSFVVPATTAFIIGLYIPYWNKRVNNNFYLQKISDILKMHKNLDVIFVIIGVFLNLTISMYSSSIRFAISLASDIRFVGLYLMLMNNRKNKWLIISGVIFMLLLTAIKHAMFHDLLLWLGFFIIILSFIKKPSIHKKVIFLVLFLFFIVAVQTIKFSLRQTINQDKGSNISLFTNLIQEQVIESNYVMSETNLSAMVTRINQGWIIARVMDYTPKYEPFANGETIVEAVKAALLPRFLAPNKIKAGGQVYFQRFTGKQLSDNTSMSISYMGEAYVNFGYIGGAVFMFLLGVFYRFYIFKIFEIAKKYSLLILFLPLIFLQVIKAESDFTVTFNYLIKGSLFVFVLFWFMKNIIGMQKL